MEIEEVIENLKKLYKKGTKTVDGRLKGGFVLEDNEINISINIAIQALEKQVPKKPNSDDCCPECQTYLKDDNDVEGLYCPNCGQKVDWGDEQ